MSYIDGFVIAAPTANRQEVIDYAARFDPIFIEFGALRVVGAVATALYNYFIFQYAESHAREIFIAASILYLVGFGLMCLKVREVILHWECGRRLSQSHAHILGDRIGLFRLRLFDQEFVVVRHT